MNAQPSVIDDVDLPFRGQVRCRGFQRISHGLYRIERDGLDELGQLVRELESWLLVLPDGARFTHLTAARLRGWDVPRLPEGVPVFAAVHGDRPRPRRPGLLCSRLVSETPGERAHGLPVDSSEEILLRAARDLGHLDLRVLVDSARHHGAIDPDKMEALLTSRRPGTRPLRAAWLASSDRLHSPGETLLEAFHRAIDVPVDPQFEVYDDAGNLLGVADLRVVATDFLHEYDGAVHRAKKQHRVDLRRERALHGSRFVRRGYTLDDLLNHALVVMHEIDRSLDRPHRLAGFRRWERMVRESLYSDVGRERLLNRWHRQTGVVDWSRTA